MKTLILGIALVTAAAAFSSPALAEDKDAARREFAEGTRRFDLNEFDAALTAFRNAYLAYEDPAFLFNIAQCHRQLGHKSEAIQFYRSYLRKRPDAANRDEVNSTVAALEADLAAERSARAATKPTAAPNVAPVVVPADALVSAPPPRSTRQPVYKKWWLWTIVGVAVAGAATGLAVGLSGSQHTEGSLMPVTVSR